MPKLNNNFAQQPQQNSFNQNSQFTDNQAQFQSTQSQSQFNEQAQPQPQKGLFSLPPSLMQIVPWIPFALEAMTGQKIPQMTGTIGEIQSSLQQIQFSLTQVLNHQQQLWTKLEGLENNASQQFTNLISQVQNIQSLRLTHSKEHKAIEYNNPSPRLPTEEETY